MKTPAPASQFLLAIYAQARFQIAFEYTGCSRLRFRDTCGADVVADFAREQIKLARYILTTRGGFEKMDASSLRSYDPATHDLVPRGLREAVEKVIASLMDMKIAHSHARSPAQLHKLANDLQRALDGEKA